jgi:hypothetical protein
MVLPEEGLTSEIKLRRRGPDDRCAKKPTEAREQYANIEEPKTAQTILSHPKSAAG